MAAANLPLELQQEIFSYLDSRSFYAARKVCRWWYVASCDSLTLSRQLKKLPIRSAVDVRRTAPQEVQRLYNEASRTLLLGMNARQIQEPYDHYDVSHDTRMTGPKVAATSRGRWLVTINDDNIALFDKAEEPTKIIAQRSLRQDLGSAQQAPWSGIAPSSSRQLALSCDGRLLAVAYERMVTIYDLAAGVDVEPVSRNVASAAGHYISGLDFEQDDFVLRVRLSGKGIVVYLGAPAYGGSTSQTGDMEHWQSKAGLRHTFLDSSLFGLGQASAGREYEARLGSLQLLRPFNDGFLFAAQKHGGGESSHYIYGHVTCSEPATGLPYSAEPSSITELAKLESYLSASDYTLGTHADSGMGSWEEMPCAHEHHPCFSMADDGSLLLLAEREKKHVRHTAMTQLFLYRLPSLHRLESMIHENETRKRERWTALARFLDRLEGRVEVEGVDALLEKEGSRQAVARLPLSLGTFLGKTKEIAFSTAGSDHPATYHLELTTDEKYRSWLLQET